MQFDCSIWLGGSLALVQIATLYIAIDAAITAAWRRTFVLAVAHYGATFGLAIHFAKNVAGNLQVSLVFVSAYALILMIGLLLVFVNTNGKKLRKGI